MDNVAGVRCEQCGGGATVRECDMARRGDLIYKFIRDAVVSIIMWHLNPTTGHAQSSARSKPATHCRGSDRRISVPHEEDRRAAN